MRHVWVIHKARTDRNVMTVLGKFVRMFGRLTGLPKVTDKLTNRQIWQTNRRKYNDIIVLCAGVKQLNYTAK